MYTNDNWFVILLSRVYFGDRVTELRHFSPLKTNNSAQLRTMSLHGAQNSVTINQNTRKKKERKKEKCMKKRKRKKEIQNM